MSNEGSIGNLLMNKYVLLKVAACIAVVLSSCQHNPVSPVIQPGATDYVWTLDTLHTLFNTITGLWGASATNVWAGGAGGTEADFLWHYDGTKWIPWYATYGGSKGLAYCSASAIFGFDSNDVWIGGQSFGDPGAGLCHWNGNGWGQYFVYNPQPDSFSGALVTDIWGTQADDIYACGLTPYSLELVPQGTSARGFLLQYDGTSWREVCRGDSGYQYQFVDIKGQGGNIFVQEYRGNDIRDDSAETVIYKVDGNKLDKMYSYIGYTLNSTMNRIGGEVYFPFGNDVYTYTNGAFIKQFSVDNPNWIQHVSGRNGNDIFLNMWDGVALFNGTDIQYIYKWAPGKTYFTLNSAVFGKDVFFSLYDGWTNYILHGTLKQ